MNKLIILFIAVIFLISCVTKPISQWSQSGTFGSELVFSLVDAGGPMIAGTSVSILTSGNLYRSQSGGTNWSLINSGFSLSGVFALVKKENMIFAGTYEDGLFRSDNQGLNWQQVNVNGNPTTGIFELGVSGQNLFAYANTGAAFYVSSNNGVNWSTAAGLNGILNQLYDNGTAFYAATYKGLYKSSNNGFNWVIMQNNGLPVNPDGSKRLMSVCYTGSRFLGSTNSPVNSIYASSDEGNSWVQSGPVFSSSSYIKSFEISGNKIFAGVYAGSGQLNGVLMSTDNGNSWINVSGGLPVVTSINVLVLAGTNLFAGTNSHGVWKAPVDQLTGFHQINSGIPESFLLNQNYPNPFNPETKISFSLPEESSVSLKITDLNGKIVYKNDPVKLQSGKYNFTFSGANLASGIYFYTLKAGDHIQTKKMVLLK